MATTRAKFRVYSITHTEYSPASENTSHVVTLTPVTGGSPENDLFYGTTPTGKIEMGIKSLDTIAQFPVGKMFYVDFTETE